MGFLHQLHLLLWKNISLKRRGPVRRHIHSPDTLTTYVRRRAFFFILWFAWIEVSWASLRPATLRDHLRSVIAVDIKHKNTAVVLLLDKVMMYAQVFTAGLWLASFAAAFTMCPCSQTGCCSGMNNNSGVYHTWHHLVFYRWKHFNVSEMIWVGGKKCSLYNKDDQSNVTKTQRSIKKIRVDTWTGNEMFSAIKQDFKDKQVLSSNCCSLMGGQTPGQ